MATPRRQWGWHQLDQRWAERLVAGAPIARGDLVLDIGAGHGVITAALLDVGARVVAVETHPDRLEHLRQRFDRRVTVVRADAADLRLPRRPFHVVANPPFSVTTPLLRRLLHPGARLMSARLVLQHAAARRLTEARPILDRQGRPLHQVSLGPRLPRSAFRPPPHVDTRILHIDRLQRGR